MNLFDKVNLFYSRAMIRLAQVIDKTRPHPSRMDEFGDRIAVSDKPEWDLTVKKVPQSAAVHRNKPRGVWYAFGSAWINMMNLQGEFAYRLKVDDSKILKLGPHNIKSFLEKFSTAIEGEDVARLQGIDVESFPEHKRQEMNFFFTEKNVVDWEAVAAQYTGVEITDLQSVFNVEKNIKWKWDFLDSWDIDGGCIWDTSIIKDAIKLGELPTFKQDDEDENSYSLHSAYWNDHPIVLSYMFKDMNGLIKGSSLSLGDRKFLELRLTHYNIHLTADQINNVDFLITPNSVTLQKVPDAPSFEGFKIDLPSIDEYRPFGQ